LGSKKRGYPPSPFSPSEIKRELREGLNRSNEEGGRAFKGGKISTLLLRQLGRPREESYVAKRRKLGVLEGKMALSISGIPWPT